MARKKKKPCCFPNKLQLFFFFLHFCFPATAAVELLFNGFSPKDLSLFANASLESRYLSLTSPSSFTLGRALYRSAVPARVNGVALTFSSSFIFSISPIPGFLPGHGFAFLFAPRSSTFSAISSQHLGLFNFSGNGNPNNHVLAIEFDVFQNPEFEDINANHVGVDWNSLTSLVSSPAGYYSNYSIESFVNLTLNSGDNYQAWVDYWDGFLNVTMAPVSLGRKPNRPLISVKLDLSDLFMDEMWVGFCAATGRLVERHRVLAWSLSNSNISASEGLLLSNLPNFMPPDKRRRRLTKTILAGVVAGTILLCFSIFAVIFMFFCLKKRKKRTITSEGEEDATEEWEIEYWPHRIPYRDIITATDGFSEVNLVGHGGNGKVYKGNIAGEAVAVKLFSGSTEEESKQFLAEVSTLGRLKHKNLVALRGWCRISRRESAAMILVYDFMQNGSLDKWIFRNSSSLPKLSWVQRMRILCDVAGAVEYLHEGCGEAVVLHRDIKASNVLLHSNMDAKLGDFGLARAHPHGHALSTTRVVGSAGYISPELLRTGKASTETDVYAFGVLVLELVCGRPAVEEGKPSLLLWVRARSLPATAVVDEGLKGTEGFDEIEAERVVEIGLACTRDEPNTRPRMRDVARVLRMPPRRATVEDGVMEEEENGDIWLLDSRLKGFSGPEKTWGQMYEMGRPHLTFDELRQSTSVSLSESDLIVEGR